MEMVTAIAVPQTARLAALTASAQRSSFPALGRRLTCTLDMAHPGRRREPAMKPSSPDLRLRFAAASARAPFPAHGGKDSRKRARLADTGRVHCSAGTTHPHVRQDDRHRKGCSLPGTRPAGNVAEKEIASWLRNAVDRPRGEAAARVEVNRAAAAAAAEAVRVRAAGVAAAAKAAAAPAHARAAAAAPAHDPAAVVAADRAAVARAAAAAEAAVDREAGHAPARGCNWRPGLALHARNGK